MQWGCLYSRYTSSHHTYQVSSCYCLQIYCVPALLQFAHFIRWEWQCHANRVMIHVNPIWFVLEMWHTLWLLWILVEPEGPLSPVVVVEETVVWVILNTWLMVKLIVSTSKGEFCTWWNDSQFTVSDSKTMWKSLFLLVGFRLDIHKIELC